MPTISPSQHNPQLWRRRIRFRVQLPSLSQHNTFKTSKDIMHRMRRQGLLPMPTLPLCTSLPLRATLRHQRHLILFRQPRGRHTSNCTKTWRENEEDEGLDDVKVLHNWAFIFDVVFLDNICFDRNTLVAMNHKGNTTQAKPLWQAINVLPPAPERPYSKMEALEMNTDKMAA